MTPPDVRPASSLRLTRTPLSLALVICLAACGGGGDGAANGGPVAGSPTPFYDHYLSFDWEHRTATLEIIEDQFTDGTASIRMNVRTPWRLNDREAEHRWSWNVPPGTFFTTPMFGGGTKDSVKIPERAWLGGRTTLPYAHSGESDHHFEQMATNLGPQNGQPFVLGRRLHHTSFVNGAHDEHAENGVSQEMVGKAGTRCVNDSRSSCHVRNGRAAPEAPGVPLAKGVFLVGDSRGQPHPEWGRVLQPHGPGGEDTVAIEHWNEANGLRSPSYRFSNGAPPRFSGRVMGPALADSLGEGGAAGSEWRTAPLWGLGLSACVTGGTTNAPHGSQLCTPVHSYPHDGRARSIDEAILWRGGEAEASKNAYLTLPTHQRQNHLRFLESL